MISAPTSECDKETRRKNSECEIFAERGRMHVASGERMPLRETFKTEPACILTKERK